MWRRPLFTCDRCHLVSDGEDLADWHDLVPRREDSDQQPKVLCPECVEQIMEEPAAAEDGITRDEAKALHAKAKELAAEARKQARDQEKRRLVLDQDEGNARLASDARKQAGGTGFTTGGRVQAGSPQLTGDARQQAEARRQSEAGNQK